MHHLVAATSGNTGLRTRTRGARLSRMRGLFSHNPFVLYELTTEPRTSCLEWGFLKTGAHGALADRRSPPWNVAKNPSH